MSNKPAISPLGIEVLELKAQGLRTHEIAKRLFISHKTVEGRWHKVLNLLDCENNSAKAIYKSYQLGLIKTPIMEHENFICANPNCYIHTRQKIENKGQEIDGHILCLECFTKRFRLKHGVIVYRLKEGK